MRWAAERTEAAIGNWADNSLAKPARNNASVAGPDDSRNNHGECIEAH